MPVPNTFDVLPAQCEADRSCQQYFMDISQAYRMQQQYYGDFHFFPLRGLKKHNYFMYKLYAHNQKLQPVFDSVLNREVLDTNYIIAIRKKLIKSILPQTRTVVTELHNTQEAMPELLRTSMANNRLVLSSLGALRSLQRTLTTYQDTQHRLIDELKQLLSGRQFSGPFKTTTEDITSVIEILNQLNDGIDSSIEILENFRRQPVPNDNRSAILLARYYVNNLVDELRKLLQVQGMVIHLLQGWKVVRSVHELQEVLN
jgi:hypothetical protein